MPSRKVMKTPPLRQPACWFPMELIDQFVTGSMSAEAMNAASMAFEKALIERGWRGAVSPSGLWVHRKSYGTHPW
jgi:hypothetical protein